MARPIGRPRLGPRPATIALAITVALTATAAGPAHAEPPVTYRPPVAAPVTDPYRAPSSPYGPGNRGIEYGTTPGAVVRAAADGVVTFAGAVAGAQYVTVRHADGLRTTLGPLADVIVGRGQAVHGGEPVGTAAGPVLLTVRRGVSYLDPGPFLRAAPPAVHLVPNRPRQAVRARGSW